MTHSFFFEQYSIMLNGERYLVSGEIEMDHDRFYHEHREPKIGSLWIDAVEKVGVEDFDWKTILTEIWDAIHEECWKSNSPLGQAAEEDYAEWYEKEYAE